MIETDQQYPDAEWNLAADPADDPAGLTLRDVLRPQYVYRLSDLAEWLQLPTEPLRLAVEAGEIPRSLGYGRQTCLLGVDVIDFCEVAGFEPRPTPAGRANLDIPRRNGCHGAQKDGTPGAQTPDAPDHRSLHTRKEFPMASAKSKTRSRAQQTKASAADVRHLPLTAIGLSGDNPRQSFDVDGIKDLAESIREVGLLQPLVCRPLDDDRFELVCGERRFKAVELLEWETITATVRELTDVEAAALRLLENVDRLDLNGCEEAAALRQLRELGHDTTSLANLLRRTEDEVEAREGLCDLPALWQAAVKAGDLSAPAAEYLVPWIDHPAVIDEMERHADKWPMPLTEWKRRLTEIVRTLSRPMEADDPAGPTFALTGDLYDRLDVAELRSRPGQTEYRAFNVKLWDELQDVQDAGCGIRDTGETAPRPETRITHHELTDVEPAGPDDEAPEPGPVFDDAYWSRLATYKAEWLRSLIVAELRGRTLDELEGFLELLSVDPAEQWTLSREFLQQHDERQLHVLADEWGIDLSDADDAEECRAILLHLRPDAMPSNLQAVEAHAPPVVSAA